MWASAGRAQRNRLGIASSISRHLLVQGSFIFGRGGGEQRLDRERPSLASGLAGADFAQVYGPVARIHASLDLAVEPGQGVAKNGAARGHCADFEPGELVDVATRLQSEMPHQFRLRFLDKMSGKRAGAFDQLPGLVRLGNSRDDARQLANDRRRGDKGGDKASPTAGVRRRHDPYFAVNPLEQAAKLFGIHIAIIRAENREVLRQFRRRCSQRHALASSCPCSRR